MAVQIKPQNQEFDLYMRVDPNTRGHHQWFFFSVKNQNFVGKVKFNIVNFTKKSSLFTQGQEIYVKSKKNLLKHPNQKENDGWQRAGDNITYGLSKICKSQQVTWSENAMARKRRQKKYYQLSFEYTFTSIQDEVFFAYSVPYTFSKCS